MALANTVQWEVRTTGNDANGGGFDVLVTSPGTDFSQQSSPQVVYTDLVIAATTTNLTSAAHPFGATHVGNIINIISGTGFTVGRYEVKSVSGVIATMDRAVGTAASTGGAGNLGGGLATPGAAATASVAQNVIWVQSGTYTLTAAITATVAYSIIGYQTSHGDNGTAPTITTATNSIALIATASSSAALWVHNFILTTTAGTPGIGINNASANSRCINVSNCTLTGFSTGVVSSAGILNVFNTWINTCGIGITAGSSTLGLNVIDCVVSGATTVAAGGISIGSADCSTSVIRTLIVGGSGDGFRMSGTGSSVKIVDSTIANNSGFGINMATAGWYTDGFGLLVQNNIIYGNGNVGIRSTAAYFWSTYIINNGMGANTGGNYTNVTAISTIAITSNPFTSSGTGDYSLNTTAGGGAVLRGAGIPGVMPNGTTTQHIDVGGVNTSSGGGGGGGGSFTFLA